MAGKKLSIKQQSFCLEYLKEFNGTKSYQLVYSVVSENVAAASASRLLRNVKIQAFLTVLTAKQAEKAEITVEWVIQELKQLYTRCQSSLTSKGAIAGATKQLELLGKHIGMWIDRSELTINIKEVNVMVVQIQGVIAKHIPDAEVRNRIAEDLKELGL